jgi:hypothetical protein
MLVCKKCLQKANLLDSFPPGGWLPMEQLRCSFNAHTLLHLLQPALLQALRPG